MKTIQRNALLSEYFESPEKFTTEAGAKALLWKSKGFAEGNRIFVVTEVRENAELIVFSESNNRAYEEFCVPMTYANEKELKTILNSITMAKKKLLPLTKKNTAVKPLEKIDRQVVEHPVPPQAVAVEQPQHQPINQTPPVAVQQEQQVHPVVESPVLKAVEKPKPAEALITEQPKLSPEFQKFINSVNAALQQYTATRRQPVARAIEFIRKGKPEIIVTHEPVEINKTIFQKITIELGAEKITLKPYRFWG